MIQKNTLKFLKDLKKNNDRDWFKANKKEYDLAKEDFIQFTQRLLNGIAEFDSWAADLTPKDCMFRINRDTRFSKNKDPYKTNFGANMSRGGRKSMYPGYYFHIAPGDTFVAGGMYKPESKDLAKVRQEIDYNPSPLIDIINDKEFKKLYGSLDGEQLKTAPKGYPKDHENIDLLRYKGFIVFHRIDDKDLHSEDLYERCMLGLKGILPLNQYLRTALD